MKIIVSASSPELSSPVDPRFGRCTYFLFVDSETMQFEAVENPNVTSSSGAGIQAAQLVVKKGAKVLLTGSCGPNAFQTLQTGGVEVVVGVTGTAQEDIQQYKSGKLQRSTQPDVSPHFGMGMGGSSPMGPGFGMGRGMGPRVPPQSPDIPQSTPEEELQYLKQQAEFLRQQKENITKRMVELEKMDK